MLEMDSKSILLAAFKVEPKTSYRFTANCDLLHQQNH